MPVIIDPSSLKNINHALARIDDLLRHKAIAHLAGEVHETAIDYADVHTKTGALFRSIYKKRINGGFEIGSDSTIAPYAIFVHWGTKPHIIKPKHKKALRWASGGMFMFAKEISHSGYKGDPFLTNALKDELPKFNQWLGRQIDAL